MMLRAPYADDIFVGQMLAVKRRPALLDQLADEMPLTRSIRQRTEEEEERDVSYKSGGLRADGALQLRGKDAHKGFTPSFALAADGSSAALRHTECTTSSRPTDAAIGPAVLQLAAGAAEETSKQAQHGAKSGRAGASAGPSSDQSSDSACQGKTGPDSRPNGPAPCCRISLPNEIPQSPRRTRSQNLSEADILYLSSLSEEAHLRSSEAHEGSQHQHSCGATPPPSSSTQLPKAARVRHRRISFTLGATDGGATTSQTIAVPALKSCMRKDSIIRWAPQHFLYLHMQRDTWLIGTLHACSCDFRVRTGVGCTCSHNVRCHDHLKDTSRVDSIEGCRRP